MHFRGALRCSAYLTDINQAAQLLTVFVKDLFASGNSTWMGFSGSKVHTWEFKTKVHSQASGDVLASETECRIICVWSVCAHVYTDVEY